jgi:hypothetical protein
MTAGTERREGQEGSRWVNRPPTGKELADWFEENVTLHTETLEHKDYVQGLTMIQQSMKEKAVVGWQENDQPVIDEVTNLYYVPYAKVETRVKYFWDYVATDDSWLGVIEPVLPRNPVASLPEGFGRMQIQQADNRIVNYITFTARAMIYLADTVEEKVLTNVKTGQKTIHRTGKLVMQGAPGTKMVPVLGRYGADDHAIMKAETGGVGRALGMAGMLVVPGSGVATAEDMLEAQQSEGGPNQSLPAAGEQAVLEDADGALRQEVTRLFGVLSDKDKPRFERVRQWVREDRKVTAINDATSPQLRGILTKLRAEIAEAEAEAEAAEKE